jgi:type I site-specific restriction endonuclease
MTEKIKTPEQKINNITGRNNKPKIAITIDMLKATIAVNPCAVVKPSFFFDIIFTPND